MKMRIPRDSHLRTDAMLTAITAAQRSMNPTEESAEDSARMFKGYLADVIDSGFSAEEGWVLLFAAACQAMKDLAEEVDPGHPEAVLAELRDDLLAESVA